MAIWSEESGAITSGLSEGQRRGNLGRTEGCEIVAAEHGDVAAARLRSAPDRKPPNRARSPGNRRRRSDASARYRCRRRSAPRAPSPTISPRSVWPARSRAGGMPRDHRPRRLASSRPPITTGVTPCRGDQRGKLRVIPGRPAFIRPVRGPARHQQHEIASAGRSGDVGRRPGEIGRRHRRRCRPSRSWSAWRSSVCIKSRRGLACGCEAPRAMPDHSGRGTRQ